MAIKIHLGPACRVAGSAAVRPDQRTTTAVAYRQLADERPERNLMTAIILYFQANENARASRKHSLAMTAIF